MKRLVVNLATAAALCAVVATLSAAPAATPHAPGAAAPPVVNVNTASVAQLCYLPHVGVKVAAQIIAARPIVSKPDIMRVKGIKGKRYAELERFVVVVGPTTATAKIKGGAR